MQVKYKKRPLQNPFVRENYLIEERHRKRAQEASPARSNQFELRSYTERCQSEVKLQRSSSTASNDVVLKALQGANPFKTPKRLKDIVRDHQDEYNAECAAEERHYTARSAAKENHWLARSPGREILKTEGRSRVDSQFRVQHLTPYLPTSHPTGPYFPPVYQPNVNMSPKTYYHLLGNPPSSVHAPILTPSFLDAGYSLASKSQLDNISASNTKAPNTKRPSPISIPSVSVRSTQKVVGYESEDSIQENNASKNNVNPGGGTFKRANDPTSQLSIDNRINYESEPEEELPEHPPVISIRGKDYFSVNLLRK